MTRRSNISNLSGAISRELQLYLEDVSGNLEYAKKETAKQLVKDLKLISPKNEGDYAKGWRVKSQGKKYIVHNATNYQLTHLLEKGHVLRRGGRKIGEVREQIHIAPAEDRAIANYVEMVERELR